MKTTDWDAVAASEPVNRLAALVAAVGYSADEDTLLAKARAAIRAIETQDPGFKNLIGVKKGRLEVVAYGGSKKGDRARWVVRCKCGNYELRTTRGLRPDCSSDRCNDCQTKQYHASPEYQAARPPR